MFLGGVAAMACGGSDNNGGGDGDGDGDVGDGDGDASGGASGDGDGDGDGDLTCSEGQEICDGACTNLDTDRQNCGECGESCAGGTVCEDGACVANCSEDRNECDGGCADIQTDPEHCGECGNACDFAGAAGACVAGECAFVFCQEGFEDCDDLDWNGCERDTMSDRRNCGGCNVRCELDETCEDGTCSGRPDTVTDNFSVVSLSSECKVIDHVDQTGDDNYGIAVTPTKFFVNGDDATGMFDSVDLGNRTDLGFNLDGMIGDIKAGKVYQLLDASDQPIDGDGQTVAKFIEIDDAGLQTGTAVTLVDGDDVATTVSSGDLALSGPGFFVLYDSSTTTANRVDFATGTVTELSTTLDVPFADYNEGWADYGVAEIVEGAISLLYPSEDGAGVDRIFVADGTTETVFTGTSDLHSFAFEPTRSRWYFHHEGASILGDVDDDENGGYCEAVWSASSCGYGFDQLCDGTCTDVSSSADHCGACDNACGVGETCVDGVCDTCAEDAKTDCDGTCADLMRDASNCGVCGEVCGDEAPYCIQGECSDAALNCAEVGDTGVFTIVPDGDPFEVYCDDTDFEGQGGGWTLLGVFTTDDGVTSWDPFGSAWTDATTTFGTPTDPTINADAKSMAFNVLPISEIAIVKAGGDVQVVSASECIGDVPLVEIFNQNSQSDLDCAMACDTAFVGGDWTGQSNQDDQLKFRCSDSEDGGLANGYVLSEDDNSFITTLDMDNAPDNNFGLGAGESGGYVDWDATTSDGADPSDTTQILLYGR